MPIFTFPVWRKLKDELKKLLKKVYQGGMFYPPPGLGRVKKPFACEHEARFVRNLFYD